MQFHVGTSGYQYKEWRGSFYPAKFSEKDMLKYDAERFSTVEINNTHYRMPTVEGLESWASQVPKTFQLVLKAPQTITHFKRLRGVEEEMDYFQKTAAVLKGRLGPLLFQLPPNFKKDLPRLESFLKLLGKRTRVAFEFRHESWFDDEVFACLRAKSCALCLADTDALPNPPLVSTADWGYIRLRRAKYSDKQLKDWIKRLKSQAWNEAYVFFKHEDSGTGPKFAARFLELAGEQS